MSHTIISTPVGYIVASTIAGIVVDASLFDSWTEAMAALFYLTA